MTTPAPVSLTDEYAAWLRTPPPAPPGSHWRRDQVYGTAGAGGRPLVLHLYAREPGACRPGILILHGGGWKHGTPYWLARLTGALAATGCVTATAEYRLSGEAAWPAALVDAKCAVRWLRAHAEEIGLDADRIAVAGDSAGGHLAAMIALTPGSFEGTGGLRSVSSAVQAAVLYNPVTDLRGIAAPAGPADTEEYRRVAREFLGGTDDELLAQASPITCVTERCPPVLTRVGDQDRITPVDACVAFHRALDRAGVTHHIEVVAGHGHALPWVDHAGCVDATTRFLGKCFDAQLIGTPAQRHQTATKSSIRQIASGHRAAHDVSHRPDPDT